MGRTNNALHISARNITKKMSQRFCSEWGEDIPPFPLSVSVPVILPHLLTELPGGCADEPDRPLPLLQLRLVHGVH